MGGIKTAEILIVDGDNLLDQKVLTVPREVARLLQWHGPTGDLRWIGPKNKDGYGVIRAKDLLDWLIKKELLRRDAHSVPAHTFVKLASDLKPLKDGETVDHRENWCPLRHPLCCHPEHTERVPNAVNSKRGNESNYKPMAFHLRFFDPQDLDAHVPPHLQRPLPPPPIVEFPLYRAKRFDELMGRDHEAIQAAFV
jgi:hypothetical protein